MNHGITHLENTGIDRRITLKWILNKECVDLFHLAQNINHRWAPVYIIMNLPFHAWYRLGQSVTQLLITHKIKVCVLHSELIRPTNLTALAQSNRRVPDLQRQEFTAFIATASVTVKRASESAYKCVEMCKTNGFISILGHQLLFALWCIQLDHHQLLCSRWQH